MHDTTTLDDEGVAKTAAALKGRHLAYTLSWINAGRRLAGQKESTFWLTPKVRSGRQQPLVLLSARN
jgi:hypothetical protein